MSYSSVMIVGYAVLGVSVAWSGCSEPGDDAFDSTPELVAGSDSRAATRSAGADAGGWSDSASGEGGQVGLSDTTGHPGLDASVLGDPARTNMDAVEAGTDDCRELLVHGQSSAEDSSPFMVPPGETYQCFYFRSPYPDRVQGTGFGSVLDNVRVIHHWLLYDLRVAHADGAVEACLGTHPDGAVLSGWAAGAEDARFPDAVGIAIPWGPEGRFVLEVHYSNSSGSAQPDRSGARVCATRKRRPHTASISWLGTENIGGPLGIPPRQVTTVSGTCLPGRAGFVPDQVIHTMTVMPHMHSLGRRMELTVHRANGYLESLLDVPFDAANQVGRDIPTDLAPGDTLETRCTFDNVTDLPVAWGPSTSQEMCYAFVLAYPAGALDHPMPSFAGAQNTCFW